MITRKVDESTLDYLKRNRIPLICLLGVLLVAVIVLIFCGFNVSTEFTGGTYVKVNVGDYATSDNFEGYADKIKKVLNSYDIKIKSSPVLQGEGANATIILETNSSLDDVKTEVQGKIVESLSSINISSEDVEISKFSKTVKLSDYLFVIFIPLGIMALGSIYMLIRHNGANSMTFIFTTLFANLIFLAFTLIFRLQVSKMFLILLPIISIIVAIENIIVMEFNKQNKELFENKQDKFTIFAKTLENQLGRQTILAVILLCLGVMVTMVCPSNIKTLGIGLLFTIFSLVASVVYLMPIIYNLTLPFAKERTKKINIKIEE